MSAIAGADVPHCPALECSWDGANQRWRTTGTTGESVPERWLDGVRALVSYDTAVEGTPRRLWYDAGAVDPRSGLPLTGARGWATLPVVAPGLRAIVAGSRG